MTSYWEDEVIIIGGIHGANRLGGNDTADIIVFGKIAGKSVMGK